ncbi:hypothetical protein Tco_0623470, partial [Tanacetum coccineum]
MRLEIVVILNTGVYNDNEIPPLEDIHEDATDGIFTHSSYDDEGAVGKYKSK